MHGLRWTEGEEENLTKLVELLSAGGSGLRGWRGGGDFRNDFMLSHLVMDALI